MPIANDYDRLPLNLIIVNRGSRQRRQIETKDLESSIRIHGVLNPIIITRGRVLVAGERRLEASRVLGLPDIPIRYHDELDSQELRIIELEENVKRRDLEWLDLVLATAEIHNIYKTRDPEWTQAETAEALAMSNNATISKYITISENISDERIRNAKTVNEAYSIITRREERKLGEALEVLLAPEPLPEVIVKIEDAIEQPTASIEPENAEAEEVEMTFSDFPDAASTYTPAPALSRPRPALIDPVLNLSFLDWAPFYTGPRFNFIHCDFPYGIHFNEAKPRVNIDTVQYDDSPEVYFALIECFCLHLDKFMSQSGHLIFWFSDHFRVDTLAKFAALAPSLVFWPFPLIWHKSDNAGVARDPTRGPRHTYETAFFASRGGRKTLKVIADSYSGPTDKRLHQNTKPEPMLRHFFEMCVDAESRVLDPTAGSASALRAAESLGAKTILGLETNEAIARDANQFYRNWKTLREGF